MKKMLIGLTLLGLSVTCSAADFAGLQQMSASDVSGAMAVSIQEPGAPALVFVPEVAKAEAVESRIAEAGTDLTSKMKVLEDMFNKGRPFADLLTDYKFKGTSIGAYSDKLSGYKATNMFPLTLEKHQIKQNSGPLFPIEVTGYLYSMYIGTPNNLFPDTYDVITAVPVNVPAGEAVKMEGMSLSRTGRACFSLVTVELRYFQPREDYEHAYIVGKFAVTPEKENENGAATGFFYLY